MSLKSEGLVMRSDVIYILFLCDVNILAFKLFCGTTNSEYEYMKIIYVNCADKHD